MLSGSAIATSNNGNGRNTAPKLHKVPGRPFAKGNDPRRNLNGRPKSFDEVRELAQQLAHTKERNGKEAITNILDSWRHSDEPALQKAFVEYAFGKVPDKLETTGLENKPILILHHGHERSANQN